MNPPDYAAALKLEEYNHNLRKRTARAIDYLMDEASRCEQQHGFGKQTPFEDVALMHSELSEALEELRNGHKPSDLYFNTESDKPLKPEGVPAEMADVIIRLGFCRRHNIDLCDAIVRKMLYNESRPFMHGGKTL